MPTQETINRIRTGNPPIEGNATTFLEAPVSPGGTSLSVLSKLGLLKKDHGDADFYVLIGGYGHEKSEIVLVDADDTLNSTMTVAALKYSHGPSEPVTYIPYNQIVFYGLSNPAGTKNQIAVVDIDSSNTYTEYSYSGEVYSFFATAFKNVSLNKISAYSDIVQIGEFKSNSVKRIIDSGARKAQTKIDERQDSVLNYDIAMEVLQDGCDEIMARKRTWSFLYKTSSELLTTAGVSYLDMPNDVLKIKFIKLGGNKITWTSQHHYEVLTSDIQSSGTPTLYTIKNGAKIYFYPIPDVSSPVYIEYWGRIADISELNDLIPREFSVILTYYCASQFAYIRGNNSRGDKMFAMFQNLLEKTCDEYSGPEQLGDAERIELTGIYSQEFDDE